MWRIDLLRLSTCLHSWVLDRKCLDLHWKLIFMDLSVMRTTRISKRRGNMSRKVMNGKIKHRSPDLRHSLLLLSTQMLWLQFKNTSNIILSNASVTTHVFNYVHFSCTTIIFNIVEQHCWALREELWCLTWGTWFLPLKVLIKHKTMLAFLASIFQWRYKEPVKHFKMFREQIKIVYDSRPVGGNISFV